MRDQARLCFEHHFDISATAKALSQLLRAKT